MEGALLKEGESGSQLKYYYYKRWVWVIFPWACLNYNEHSDFSTYISKVYAKDCEELSETDENIMYLSKK
jgi:hypothetical protein